jgi:hypothetical protein
MQVVSLGARVSGLSRASQFRFVLLVVALAALALSLFELFRASQPNGQIVSILAFAVWCTSPVLLWSGWGLVVAGEGGAHRVAVGVVGSLLVPAFVGFHLLVASSDSSTASLGYVTFPLGLLFGTAIAGGFAGGLAARSMDRTAAGDEDSRLLAEFRDRTHDMRRR